MRLKFTLFMILAGFAFILCILAYLKILDKTLKSDNGEQNIPSKVADAARIQKIINDAPSWMEGIAVFPKDDDIEDEILSDLKLDYSKCQMDTCFNFKRCRDGLKIYVYPLENFVHISVTYEKILNIIMSSKYYTNNVDAACLFVLSIDTLDRDTLSRDFVRSVATRLKRLEHWNDGENHIVFNLYAGTWPHYNESELKFATGKAILAKASMSVHQYRPGFDISLPLFHQTHLEKGEDLDALHAYSTSIPQRKQYTLAFKGKRYVYGIGSETRNSIYHLHNNADVVMVTTCRHGKNWKEMQDERCDADNKEYERYSYNDLLENSSFCLVPRGRRLGSFRFLEVLRVGCVPVILSNGWILPFSEVIDWKAASVTIDERNLLQTVDIIRSIDEITLFKYRQQIKIIWDQYLSSLDKILETTFEIIRDRIDSHLPRDMDVWNTSPGALSVNMQYSDDIHRFPFYHRGHANETLKPNFTSVIFVKEAELKSTSLSGYSTSPLFRLVRNAGNSRFVSKIIVVWSARSPPPRVWPRVKVPFNVIKGSSANQVFSEEFRGEVTTDAVFFMRENVNLKPEHLDYAYETWRSFPSYMVGYKSRFHYWDESKESWRMSSKLTNDYSMVLMDAVIYHAYYGFLFWTNYNPSMSSSLMSSDYSCEEILMNMIVGKITKHPPLKLISWKSNEHSAFSTKQYVEDTERLILRDVCLNELAEDLNFIGLRRSAVRLDPVLFKDSVSKTRKKYLNLES